jgi:L-aminopeptidase/D-esterase-like protein
MAIVPGITAIEGIRVGHATDLEAITGCTVVLCERGAVAGVEIRGGATGSEELDVMSPGHITPHVHAVMLSGGSAFGLEAASGARRWLERRGIGFRTGAAVVPIVPAAILYDLGIGQAGVRPTREMGEAACEAATAGELAEGNAGAGTGATCGKYFGLRRAMKAGIGTALAAAGGVKVGALVAVNPVGDVLDPATGRILAGARTAADSREFADTAAAMKSGAARTDIGRTNTTLAVVATNARLTKVEANRLAQLAHHGFVRAIRPVHTSMDGDLAIALSCGEVKAPVDLLGLLAADAVAEAIVRAVRAARTLGGVPGLAT